MIRFIDLRGQIVTLSNDAHFAFFDTVSDKFLEFSGFQEWDSIEDFTADYDGNDDIERFLKLIPDGYFEPKLENKSAEQITRKYSSFDSFFGEYVELDDCVKAMEEYAGYFRIKWISIKEELPATDRGVLFSSEGGVAGGVFYKLNDDGTLYGHYDNGTPLDDYITHWAHWPTFQP